MFSRPSSAQIAKSYQRLAEIPKIENFSDPAKEWKPSPWAEVSGVRNRVNGQISKAVNIDVEPAPKLPPIFLDQSVIDTFHDYNFNGLTTTREDVQNWNKPISQEWLDRYNTEMKFKEKEEVTLEEVEKNPYLRKVIAQPQPKAQAQSSGFGSKIKSGFKWLGKKLGLIS